MPRNTGRLKTVSISVLGAAVFVAQLLTLCAIIRTKMEALKEQKSKLERLANAAPWEQGNDTGSQFAPDYLFVDAQCEHEGLW